MNLLSVKYLQLIEEENSHAPDNLLSPKSQLNIEQRGKGTFLQKGKEIEVKNFLQTLANIAACIINKHISKDL